MTDSLTIWVCGNTETLTDGYDILESEREEAALDAVSAASDIIDQQWPKVVSRPDIFYANWHGGKHTQTHVCGKPWGYRSGWLTCHFGHEMEPPEWLVELMGRASNAMEDVLRDYLYAPGEWSDHFFRVYETWREHGGAMLYGDGRWCACDAELAAEMIQGGHLSVREATVKALQVGGLSEVYISEAMKDWRD